MNEAEAAAGLPQTPSYRYADVVGDRLYLAGQVPNDPAGEIVGIGSPAAQARRCLENLAMVVTANGFTIDDVRRMTIHVVGPHEALLDAWSGVVGWFGDEVPPATLLGVPVLGYARQLVEIDADVERRRP